MIQREVTSRRFWRPEHPNDCERVGHKSDPGATCGKNQHADIYISQKYQAKAVKTKQNSNDADNNPCPASGAEKTDGGRRSESTETRTNESADDSTVGQTDSHVQKPQTLNEAEGHADYSEQQPNRTDDTVVCHALSNGLYDAPIGSFIEIQKPTALGQHLSDPSAFSNWRFHHISKPALTVESVRSLHQRSVTHFYF